MTPERFGASLNHLRWSQLDLAAALECDVFLVNAWCNGLEPVPDDIATWLDALAVAHEIAGVPKSYRGVQLKMKIGRS